MRIASLTLAALAVSTSSPAQTPVGQFAGAFQDSFETQLSSSFDPCVVGDVLQGLATLCAGNAHLASSWVGSSCQIMPNSGNVLFGATSGSATLEFTDSVSRFGAWFGNNSTPNTVLANFFDSGGVSVGSAPVTVNPDCVWVWNGWDLTGLDVTMIQLVPSTGRVMLDDLEADTVIELGTNFCSSSVNSTGMEALISATGSTSIAANDLVLHAETLPSGEPGIFYYGRTEIQATFGDGFRCIGLTTPGSIVRLFPFAVADPGGHMSFAVDNTMPPSMLGQIDAGETWKFQAWFRDPGAMGSGFNLSDGLSLTFLP
jgi:hypothetical protein